MLCPKNKLLLFILFFLPVQAFSQTYYLDASGGNNANDGLSPATAWKSIFKINGTTGGPGVQFLFKRGEVWEGERIYIGFSGSAAAPVEFGAYPETSDPEPVVTTLTDITGADNTANWTNVGTNRWRFFLPTNPGRIFLNGNEVLRAPDAATVGQTDDLGYLGYWFYYIDPSNNSAANYLEVYATQNPALEYTSIEGSNFFCTVQVDVQDHLRFENLNIQGGGASICVTGGHDIEIKNCTIGKDAASGIFLLNSNSNVPTGDVLILHNTIDSHFTFSHGLGTERGCGDGINMRDGVQNCTVTFNTFKNWAHNAIELYGYSSSAVGVNDNYIADNDISAPDIPYAHPLGADGLLNKCMNNIFERNHAVDCRTATQINGNNNIVRHNIFERMRRSPAKAVGTAFGLSLGIYGEGLVCQDNVYDYNLFIDLDEAGLLFRTYDIAGTIQGNYFRNNIFTQTGLDPFFANSGASNPNQYNAGAAIVIYDQGGLSNADAIGTNYFQNNLAFSNQNAAAFFIRDEQYFTATEVNNYAGNLPLIFQNNLFGDPDLDIDYLPSNTSPAVNTGITIPGVTSDYFGNPRVQGGASDIGVLETSVVLPVEWGSITARARGNDILVMWEVLEERNNLSFSIERKEANNTWKRVGEEIATGENVYFFKDKEPLSGKNIYRVKQTDFDSNFSYSPFASADFNSPLQIKLTALGFNEFRVELPSDRQNLDFKLSVVNAAGVPLIPEQTGPRFSLKNYPAGIYFVQIRMNSKIELIPLNISNL